MCAKRSRLSNGWFKVPLSQGQFDALVDFAFNLGSGRLATSTLLQNLNAGNYDDAAGQLLRWDHAGATGNRRPQGAARSGISALDRQSPHAPRQQAA